MGIKDRLARLEGEAGCMRCGWGPGVEVEVVWDDVEGSDVEEPEYCPACGHPEYLVITWPDAEDSPGTLVS